MHESRPGRASLSAGLVQGWAARHVRFMRDRLPQLLDMTPQGEFVSVPRRSPWPLRLGIGAALVAVAASGLLIAALLMWVASLLLAGVVAYAAFRFQRWQGKKPSS